MQPSPGDGTDASAGTRVEVRSQGVTVAGRLLGLNWQDQPVVRADDGTLHWLYDDALAQRCLARARAPLPADVRRHRPDAALAAALASIAEVVICGGHTVADFAAALAPYPVWVRGSRVRDAVLTHGLGMSPGAAAGEGAEVGGARRRARAAAFAAYRDARAVAGDVADVDLVTAAPPSRAAQRLGEVAPAVAGRCGPGGLASPLKTLFHGVTTFHGDQPGDVPLDVASLCVEGSLAPRQRVVGAYGQVTPCVFGADLLAFERQGDFASLYYDLATGDLVDPSGHALDDLRAGQLQLAGDATRAPNPMRLFRACRATACGLELTPGAAAALRAEAAAAFAAKPADLPALLARAAPAHLPDADAALTWARGRLRQDLVRLGAADLYDQALAPIDVRAFCLQLRQRRPATVSLAAAQAVTPGRLASN